MIGEGAPEDGEGMSGAIANELSSSKCSAPTMTAFRALNMDQAPLPVGTPSSGDGLPDGADPIPAESLCPLTQGATASAS